MTLNDSIRFDAPCWEHASDNMVDVIIRLLQKNQHSRMDLKSLIDHEWFKK